MRLLGFEGEWDVSVGRYTVIWNNTGMLEGWGIRVQGVSFHGRARRSGTGHVRMS